MKWMTVFVSALLLAGFSASEGKAQTIQITETDTSVGGQITVTAQITLPANWSVSNVRIIAPPAGGKAGEGGARYATDAGGGKWKATVPVKKGNYDVIGILTPKNDKNLLQEPVFSARKNNVTVN